MSQDHDLTIEPATEADLPLIRALIGELADYEKLADEAVATLDSLRDSLFGSRPSAETLIARSGGESAGFALFFHNYSTFLGRHGLYLEDLYVRPAFRGRGIGRALLVHLARLALARGCGRFQWAVLDWNRPARDFYESLGALPHPSWVSYRIEGDALRRLADVAAAPG
jgi:GNAT superfamily N-acetyltransferase